MLRRIPTALLIVQALLIVGLSTASIVRAQYDDPPKGGDDNPPPGCGGTLARVTIDSVAMTFNPSTITIDPGQPVCWSWSTGGVPHNVQADNDGFRSGPPEISFTFQRTFNEPGTFAYHCEVHGSLTGGMRGEVIVRGEEEPPPPPQLRLAATTYTVAEGATLTVVVQRLGEPNGAASVKYDQSSGSAKAGVDFTRKAGTLRWASGEGGSKSFPIATKTDQRVEGNETFTVRLSRPTGVPLGDSVATVTIEEPNSCPASVLEAGRLTARGRSADAVEVSWTPAREAAVTWLERRAPGGSYETLPVSTAHGHFQDSGLLPGTVYQYRLRAEGADGSIAMSPSVSAATDTAPSPCHPEAGEGCLLGGRFAATLRFDGAEFRTPRWRPVEGSPATLVGSSSPGTRELLLHLSDGCAENGHYWASVAAVTDLEFAVTVRDTVTGRTWIQLGGPGKPAPSLPDRDAFVCGGN